MDSRFVESVRAVVDKILPNIVRIRRTIHQYPEIAREEYETAALIRKTLSRTGLRLLDPFLETDVVALLDGKNPGQNVTLRADMDALPLEEKTGRPYISKRPGFMHACGHDGHTAMLLGAALVLSRFKDIINGSVRFVFQPGEEIVAAGRDLVKKGALLDPEPNAVFALHGLSGFPEGVLGSRPGPMMAAGDFFRIMVKGRGAHGSQPEASIDPVLTAARVVEALQAIVSRHMDPMDAVVLSVCRIFGGTNANIIPDNVEIEGTTRYFKPELMEKIRGDMERIIRGVCDSMGASYEFEYASPYRPLINSPDMAAFAAKVTRDVLGHEYWLDIEHPCLGAEDFSYYLIDYPGAFLRLGMGMDSSPLHNANFDFNDNAMKNGIMFLVCAALEFLTNDAQEK